MNFEFLDVELRSQKVQISIRMAYETKRAYLLGEKGRNFRPVASSNSSSKALRSSYFSVESVLVLLFLTASLLLLPLVLPPLPPPPLLLLLLPLAILGVLLVLAFIPSDVRNLATPYA